jgi:hypothetical protein
VNLESKASCECYRRCGQGRTTEYTATVAFFRNVLGLGVTSSQTDFTVLDVPDGATVEVFAPASHVNRHLTPRGRIPGV